MTKWSPAAAFATAPVAVLGTADAQKGVHLVPVVFAVDGLDEPVPDGHPMVYTAVDAKRKSTHRLRRLANIAADPRVSLLVHGYDEDWSQLWWVRADGVATIHESGEEMATGYGMLRRKYVQYERTALDGPVVTIAVAHWSSWQA